MVAIFKYANGLQFTGLVAENENQAWEYLDKTYGTELYAEGQFRCNHNAFCLKKVELIKVKDKAAK